MRAFAVIGVSLDGFIASGVGGLTIQGFLRAGLIQRLVIPCVPVLIGTGVPLFGAIDRDGDLRHIATRTVASGLIRTRHEVAG